MPGKSQYKILPEHRELILTLKRRGCSDGRTYLQYMRRMIDDKLPIESAITYEGMRKMLRSHLKKDVQK